MEPVEFRDMLYVLAVYEEGSFSRAAEKCYISQPALSKIVKKVEGNLGVLIFDRGSFPLKVTAEGENFIEYFQRIEDIRREMENYCDEIRLRKKSDLNIGAPSFFCTYVLPPIVTAFQMEMPGCSIKLIETNDSDLRKFLKAGIVDMGISVEENMSPEFESFVLKHEFLILAVPSNYPVNESLCEYAVSYEDICSGRFRSPEVLSVPMEYFADERFLFLKQGNDMHRRGLKFCRDAGFEPKIVMELDQLLTAYYLAGAGEGATFTRASIPYYAGPSESLTFYKIDHPEMTRRILVYRNRKNMASQKQKAFMEYIRNYPLPG